MQVQRTRSRGSRPAAPAPQAAPAAPAAGAAPNAAGAQAPATGVAQPPATPPTAPPADNGHDAAGGHGGASQPPQEVFNRQSRRREELRGGKKWSLQAFLPYWIAQWLSPLFGAIVVGACASALYWGANRVGALPALWPALLYLWIFGLWVWAALSEEWYQMVTRTGWLSMRPLYPGLVRIPKEIADKIRGKKIGWGLLGIAIYYQLLYGWEPSRTWAMVTNWQGAIAVPALVLASLAIAQWDHWAAKIPIALAVAVIGIIGLDFGAAIGGDYIPGIRTVDSWFSKKPKPSDFWAGLPAERVAEINANEEVNVYLVAPRSVLWFNKKPFSGDNFVAGESDIVFHVDGAEVPAYVDMKERISLLVDKPGVGYVDLPGLGWEDKDENRRLKKKRLGHDDALGMLGGTFNVYLRHQRVTEALQRKGFGPWLYDKVGVGYGLKNDSDFWVRVQSVQHFPLDV